MKTMNLLQKLGMKFQIDNKKRALSLLLFLSANTFVFAQEQSIVPSTGFTFEGFFERYSWDILFNIYDLLTF